MFLDLLPDLRQFDPFGILPPWYNGTFRVGPQDANER